MAVREGATTAKGFPQGFFGSSGVPDERDGAVPDPFNSDGNRWTSSMSTQLPTGTARSSVANNDASASLRSRQSPFKHVKCVGI